MNVKYKVEDGPNFFEPYAFWTIFFEILKYYLFNFRETQTVALELTANIAEQTGMVKPSRESTTEYAEKTLEQKPRSDVVKLPPHCSGRKLQVPILPNIFSCNI